MINPNQILLLQLQKTNLENVRNTVCTAENQRNV